MNQMQPKVYTRLQKIKLIGSICAAVTILDQLTKVWAQSLFRGELPIVYLNDFFRFEYAENRGAFLSLGAQFSEPARILVFNVAVAFFLAYVVYVLLRKELPFWQMISFTLLLSGGFGNLIDRIFRGAVIDFMNMGIGNLRTGIFNIADVVIMMGLFLMLLPEKWLKMLEPKSEKSY